MGAEVVDAPRLTKEEEEALAVEALARRASQELGPEQKIMLSDKPVEEAITPQDVAENVLPWGGLKARALAAVGGTIFDATYGNNTKDYEPDKNYGNGEMLARAITDMAFGARKAPERFVKSFAPMVVNKVSKTVYPWSK